MEIVDDHYKKGDPFPPRTNTDVLRIYNFRTCPFAERALLVAAAKDIKLDIVNVKLRDQLPEWVRERNPLGKVPFIEVGPENKVLCESLIIVDYLDEAFPGRKLTADDPFQKASDRLFVETISPLLMTGKLFYSKEDKSVIWKEIQESLKKADELLANRRNGKFLSGKDLPGITDYVIWPFVERVAIAVEILTNESPEVYLKKEVPTIADYRQQLLSDPTVKKVSLEYEKLRDFNKAVLKTRA